METQGEFNVCFCKQGPKYWYGTVLYPVPPGTKFAPGLRSPGVCVPVYNAIGIERRSFPRLYRYNSGVGSVPHTPVEDSS